MIKPKHVKNKTRKPLKREIVKRKVKVGTLNVKTGRVFMMRRKSNPLRTVKDLTDWLYDATGGQTQPEWDGDINLKLWTVDTLKQAVLWMYAMDQADTWSDLRRKDIADILLTGIKPITLSEIQSDWLDCVHNDGDDDDPRTAILDVLEDHFQVKDPYS